MLKKLVIFFDHLEDKIRAFLSSKPIIYALVASFGIVLLWRGVWLMADSLYISGPISFIIGAIVLLLTGVFVSAFVGNRILLTGLRNEKKLAEKTKKEIEMDMNSDNRIFNDLTRSLKKLNEILSL